LSSVSGKASCCASGYNITVSVKGSSISTFVGTRETG